MNRQDSRMTSEEGTQKLDGEVRLGCLFCSKPGRGANRGDMQETGRFRQAVNIVPF